MLDRIDLRHFKCFEMLKLPLRRLTLLSGANASGKSSVLQALVLVHQTMREHEWASRLMLNGYAVQLGTVADVIDHVYGRRNCEISLRDNTGYFHWVFSGGRDDMSMDVSKVRISDIAGVTEEKSGRLHHLLPESRTSDFFVKRMCRLTYLTAERLGPREYYKLDDPELTPVIGPQGEYAASVLYSGRDAHVLERMLVENVPPTRFRQVEARMGQFFPDCRLTVERVRGANAVTLGIRMSPDTEFHRPIHTGFGLTQVLPIMVAAASADYGDVLLIENPEIHLHPAGQAQMGEFLAEVAAAGVQVLLETHSDHVLNGVRRAVKKSVISPDNVALHFFQLREEAQRTGVEQVQTPMLDAEGNIDSWPDGFFDQFDKDMNYFAGWS